MDKFTSLFHEFEGEKTPEAKFAKAIDVLDHIIQELDYKQDGHGLTEEFLRLKKERYVQDFPELKRFFDDLLIFAQKEKYFH